MHLQYSYEYFLSRVIIRQSNHADSVVELLDEMKFEEVEGQWPSGLPYVLSPEAF